MAQPAVSYRDRRGRFRWLPLLLLVAAAGMLLPRLSAALRGTLPWSTGSAHRETSASPGAPSISFIDSPTAECYGPLEELDVCYVQWGLLDVSASPSQYIERMTVTIDGRIRAYYGGFFQTSMTVTPSMHPPGFKVRCGGAGAGGDPEFGFQYAYTIRAKETGGLTATNYGTAICPAETRLLFRDGFE